MIKKSSNRVERRNLRKMGNEKPAFKNLEGVAVWKGIDVNGNEYLSIKLPLFEKIVKVFANIEKGE